MTSHVDLTYITKYTPFWGNVTSTLDWCEYNYQFSPYIAELANTVSNIAIISLALYGYWRSTQESLPSMYSKDYLGLLMVGLGSAAFHGSLLYEAQLADELPILSATHTSYVLYQTNPGKQDVLRQKRLANYAIIFVILFSLSYSFVYRNPVYHQAVFATLLLSNAYQTMKLRRQQIVPLSQGLQSQVVKIFWSGGFSFLLAFFIWNMDNIFCGKLREWKNAFGWPSAFLLEGHSWWHLLTGLGGYLMAVGEHYLLVTDNFLAIFHLTEYSFRVLSIEEGEKNIDVEYHWGLPHIVRSNTPPKEKKS